MPYLYQCGNCGEDETVFITDRPTDTTVVIEGLDRRCVVCGDEICKFCQRNGECYTCAEGFSVD